MMDYLFLIPRFFQSGGWWMYPILFVFGGGVAISIERYIKLSYATRRNRNAWNEVRPILEEGDFDHAREITSASNTELGTILSLGLSRQGAVRRRDDIEIAMEEGMLEIIPQLEKRTPYVALCSNMSTMLGLLGTIMGLIGAFTAVADANPAEKADLLARYISVAMNTTAFGLMAGIPLLFVHAILSTKTTEIVDSLEMAQVKTLNIMTEFAKQDTSF